MKKVIYFTLLLLFCSIANAQDTLTAFKPTWFYNYHSIERPITGSMGTGVCDITKVFYTDHPRYIYGVAVAANTYCCVERYWKNLSDAEKEFWYDQVEDTNLSHCEEFIRAYEYAKDTINILREGLCNITTPPSYYLELPDEITPHWADEWIWRLSIYEVYFDEPLWVTDSFYVGMSQYLPKRNSMAEKWPVWPMIPVKSPIIVMSDIPDNLHYPFNILFSPDSNCSQWYYSDDLPRTGSPAPPYTSVLNGYTLHELWFFPIVDSGSWEPPHHEGIAPRPSGPTIDVSPNPTTGKVAIHSEHNISYIEIYNSQGQLADIHNAQSTSCELDLSSLPSGVYFLHLYTSGGTATKRVLKK